MLTQDSSDAIVKRYHDIFSCDYKGKKNYDTGERALPLFLKFMTFYDTIRYFETPQVPENQQLLCLIVFCIMNCALIIVPK